LLIAFNHCHGVENDFLGRRERKICRGSAFEGTFFGSVMLRIIETERCLEWTHGHAGKRSGVSPENGEVTPVSA